MIIKIPYEIDTDKRSPLNKSMLNGYKEGETNNFDLWIHNYDKKHHDMLKHEGKDENNDNFKKYYNEELVEIQNDFLVDYNNCISDSHRRFIIKSFRYNIEYLYGIWDSYIHSGLYGIVTLKYFYSIKSNLHYIFQQEIIDRALELGLIEHDISEETNIDD